jgi:hypothetical protein
MNLKEKNTNKIDKTSRKECSDFLEKQALTKTNSELEEEERRI